MPKNMSASKARHNRLFELMYQSNRAETVNRRQKVQSAQQLEPDVIAQFQRRAFTSLQPGPRGSTG